MRAVERAGGDVRDVGRFLSEGGEWGDFAGAEEGVGEGFVVREGGFEGMEGGGFAVDAGEQYNGDGGFEE